MWGVVECSFVLSVKALFASEGYSSLFGADGAKLCWSDILPIMHVPCTVYVLKQHEKQLWQDPHSSMYFHMYKAGYCSIDQYIYRKNCV